MRYLARHGAPFSSRLIVEIAIDGRALPTMGRRTWYSCSEMYSHVCVLSCKPRYSSMYAWSQITLSDAMSVLCDLRFRRGARWWRLEADTWRANDGLEKKVLTAASVALSDMLWNSEEPQNWIRRAVIMLAVCKAILSRTVFLLIHPGNRCWSAM